MTFLRYLIYIALFLHPPIGMATTFIPSGFEDRVRAAKHIAEARVVSTKTTMSNDKVVTLAQFEMLDVIHGDSSRQFVEISYMGGHLGDIEDGVAGSRLPQVGDHGVYLFESIDQPFTNPQVGWEEGRYPVRTIYGEKRFLRQTVPPLKKYTICTMD